MNGREQGGRQLCSRNLKRSFQYFARRQTEGTSLCLVLGRYVFQHMDDVEHSRVSSINKNQTCCLGSHLQSQSQKSLSFDIRVKLYVMLTIQVSVDLWPRRPRQVHSLQNVAAEGNGACDSQCASKLRTVTGALVPRILLRLLRPWSSMCCPLEHTSTAPTMPSGGSKR